MSAPWWIACLWRGFHRCPHCQARWCTVYGAVGLDPVSPSIFLMHRGWSE